MEPGSRPSLLERLSALLTRAPEDREHLLELLHTSFERNLLDADALSMIEGVLQVSQMQVRDIMVSRTQMVVVHEHDKPKNFLPIIIESAHSRFPVMGNHRDEVIGILLAKDLLSYRFNKDDPQFNIRDILRPVEFVPESKRLDTLLKEFLKLEEMPAVSADRR